MIGVLVRFSYGDAFDRIRLEEIAQEASSMFRGMPALRFKFFSVDDAGREATNFYVWDSRAAAEQFFSPDVRKMVTELYGAAPTITFMDIVATVDNSAAVSA